MFILLSIISHLEEKEEKILIFFLSFFFSFLLRFWINRYCSVAYGHPLCDKILAWDQAKCAQGRLKAGYTGEYFLDTTGMILDNDDDDDDDLSL